MPVKRIWNLISMFESSMSAAEWAWRIVTFISIGGSGAVSVLFASQDTNIGQLGPIYWFAIGLSTSLLVAVIIYLVKLSNLRQAEAEYQLAMANPKSSINPLMDSFCDQIIGVEDLRLPSKQLHQKKLFKRCKFVGPAAIAISGGSYSRISFIDCGDVIVVPDNALVTGIVLPDHCTVEDCEFIRVSVLADEGTAKGFQQVGANVKGLSA